MNVSDTLRLTLQALEASSPHIDAKYLWKDEQWVQLRAEAITATAEKLEQLARRTVCVCGCTEGRA